MMKKIFKNVLLFLLFVSISEAQFCQSSFDCNAQIDPKTGTQSKNLQCTLPSLPSAKIEAIDVFDASGELKTYFGTGETVCDVLGWMSDSIPYIKSHYAGMITVWLLQK